MSFAAVRQSINGRLSAKADALLNAIEASLDRILMGWLLAAGLASALRIATSPAGMPDVHTVAPYLILILAPFASMVLALRWFNGGDRQPQPAVRFARIGCWRDVGRDEALCHPLFGAGGIMVSLMVGVLLNVPVRAAEYLAAVPALSGAVPSWLATLHLLMTVDVVLLSSLYVVAFVAALRHVPSFPRLLVSIWLLDLTMQVVIAQMVAAAPGLPPDVAGALHALLEGNIHKVLISAGLWLPYLVLSTRVNLTYRRRLPA